MTTGKTIALTRQTFVCKVVSLTAYKVLGSINTDFVKTAPNIVILASFDCASQLKKKKKQPLNF